MRPTGILPNGVIESKVRGNAKLFKMRNGSTTTDINCGEPLVFGGVTVVASKNIYCRDTDGQWHAGNMITPFGDVPVIEIALDPVAIDNYAAFDLVSYDPVNHVGVPDGTAGSIKLGRAAPRGSLGDDPNNLGTLPVWSNGDAAASAGESCILVILTPY